MGINSIKTQSTHIMQILRENGLSDQEKYLEELLNKIDTHKDSLSAITEIQGMCHPKWLGDLYVKDLNLKEWSDILNKLNSACSKTMRKTNSSS